MTTLSSSVSASNALQPAQGAAAEAHSSGFEMLSDISVEICVTCVVFFLFWLTGLRPRTSRSSKKTSGLPQRVSPKDTRTPSTVSLCEPPKLRTSRPARPTGRRDWNKFAHALAATARDGRSQELPALVEEARAHGVDITSDHLMSALRSCVKAQQFGAGLAAYEALAGLVPEDCGDVWSILLFCAVEVGALRRCPGLYRKICASQPPSGNDFVNIVRCYARSEDASGLWRVLEDRAQSGFPLDLVARNRGIASCIETSSLEMAEMIFDDAIARGEEVDVVSYNTLIKGYARAGKLRRCFEILREMETRSVKASELTFGIMLEACVGSGDADLLLEVFRDLRRSGIQVNAVHYTALIKGLAAAQRLPEAKAAFFEMRRSEHLKPDVIAYSTLMKALCDARAMTDAVELLEVMLAERVRPDSIVFHNLFLGFHAHQTKPETVFRAFELMKKEGIQPTTMTLSIFLKCLAGTGLLGQVLAALESIKDEKGHPPEPRLYAQLGWDCIRSRCGSRVVEVYEAMARAAQSRGEAIGEAVHDQFVTRCVQGGMLQTAEELRSLVRAGGCDISRAAEQALASAGRKDRTHAEGRKEEAVASSRNPALAPRREKWHASPGLSKKNVSLNGPWRRQ